MFARDRTNRLTATLVTGLVALPLAVDPERTSKTGTEAQQAAVARPAILRGRVTNEAGEPLADVRILVAITDGDRIVVDDSTPHKRREARSDAGGEYRLELPEIAVRRTVSIDAMKPGYRRLVPRDVKNVEICPGTDADVSLVLKPGLYVSGLVVDEHGRPIPGVGIAALAVSPQRRVVIEPTSRLPDGRFELFNYPVKPLVFQGGVSKGIVHFLHPDYVARDIDDVYALAPEEREALRIVLGTGYKVAGTVLDAAGNPVPKAMIKVARKDGTHRKATLSDVNGEFALRGLSGGLTMLSARATVLRQRLQMPMALHADRTDLELRLKPILLPDGLQRYDVLGMQLTDVTPELKSTYDLLFDRGALILDPGKDSARLDLGRLEEGYVFALVGNKRIGSVREFVDQILAETTGQNAEEYRVRVVYLFSRVELEAASTRFLKLTKDDLKQMQMVSDQFMPETP